MGKSWGGCLLIPHATGSR